LRRISQKPASNLGNTLAQTPGRLPEAIAEYEAALRIRPDSQLQLTVDRIRAGGSGKRPSVETGGRSPLRPRLNLASKV
jgi:hypothetical protein